MFKTLQSITAIFFLATAPLIASAQPTTFAGLVDVVIGLINIAIPLLFAIVFLYFMWKMVDNWILHADDQGKREAGRRYALSAVIVFVIMIAAWGIVAIVRDGLFGF